ncbi:marvel domain-containing protein [Rhexocercosporidium sp. MPI-PUGE-AT-0058]|nr:marvel domain-containing protein [Rhexocercosporidium sp. MPI-PUGE-AT-0058]
MIITLAARAFQLALAAVVLALAVVLINGYGPGSGPALIGYGAFCGGAGIVVAAIGVAAVFFDRLQGVIMLALDAFAAFFLLAGGLAFAIKTKVGDCTKEDYLNKHISLFTPSIRKLYGNATGKKWAKKFVEDTENRCRIIQADTALVWILFACFLITAALSFVNGRSTKRGGGMV